MVNGFEAGYYLLAQKLNLNSLDDKLEILAISLSGARG